MTRFSKSSASKPLRVIGLFAGIGGFEVGLARAGHRVELLCECDPDAVAVLKARFADIPIVDDVRNTEELIRKIPRGANLLTAGFPCSDLSQAGKKLGLRGPQSSLVRQVLELLSVRPFEHVLLENVPNWRRLHRGKHMKEVLSGLERLGYRWAYRTIDTLAFGVPQRRPRIFLYATLAGDPREVLFRGDRETLNGSHRVGQVANGFYWTEGTRGIGWGIDCVPALKGGSGLGIPSAPAILLKSGSIVTPDVRDAERMQGFAANWTKASKRAALRRETRRRDRRLVLVGNAVNTRVAHWIGRRLRIRTPFRGPIGTALRTADPLPQAAWFDGECRYAYEIGAWPVARSCVGLEEFLKFEGKPLSKRATRGFLARLENSERLAPSPRFLTRLRRYVREAPE